MNNVNNAYQQLEEVWAALPMEQKSEPGHVALNDNQQTVILNAIKQCETKDKPILWAKVCKNAEITKLALSAICNKPEYFEMDKDFTMSMLENLQGKILSCPNDTSPQVIPQLISSWLINYGDHFNKAMIDTMDTDEVFHLAEILAKGSENDQNYVDSILNNLPEKACKFYEFLKSSSKENWQSLPESFSDQERTIALAHIISYYKLEIYDIRETLTDDQLEQIAPYLRYCDYGQLDTTFLNSLLEKSKKINYLYVSDPDIEKIPVELSNCRTLHCPSCKNLEELPDLPVCRLLVCIFNYSLRQLPDLPNCERVSCNRCTSLQKISDLPACEFLLCSDCDSLEEILSLPACLKLICINCKKLRQVAEQPSCEDFNCSGCVVLPQLPLLPKSRTVNCSSCLRLTQISDLSACLTLYCSNCRDLQSISGLLLCQKVICSKCVSLSDIIALNACTELDCSECTNLQRLTGLDHCEILTCSGCSILAQIPLAPALQVLDCANCPQLQEDLPIPPDCEVIRFSEEETEYAQMRVDEEEISDNPKSLLSELGNILLLTRSVPSIEYYQNGQPSPAVDAGGVQRDFITRLLNGVFSPAVTATHLQRINDWPVLPRDQFNDDNAHAYRSLGRVFAYCYPEDSTLKPGAILPQIVYEAMLCVENPSSPSRLELLNQYLFTRGISPSVLKFCSDQDPGAYSQNDLYTAALLYFDEDDWEEAWEEHHPNQPVPDPADFFKEPANRLDFEKRLFERASSDGRVKALGLIAEGMQEVLGDEEWARLRGETSLSLMEKIQGKVSREIVLNAIQWEHEGSVTAENQVNTVRFLREWIEGATEDQLRRFVKAITGNNALGANITIKVQTFNRDTARLPDSHTCSLGMELPVYENQDQFNQRLNTFAEHASEGFGYA